MGDSTYDSEARLIFGLGCRGPESRFPGGAFIRILPDRRKPEKSADGSAQPPESRIAESYKLRLAVSELKIGMFVCELDRPWLDSPFGFQGFPLRTVEDIQAVKRVCAYVFIDTEKSVGSIGTRRTSLEPIKPKVPSASTAAEPPRRAGRWLRTALRGWTSRCGTPAAAIQSLEVAHRAYDETSKLTRSVMDGLYRGRGIDSQATKEVVAGCADQVMRDPMAMTLLASVKDADQYTAQHSLNVAILSMVLGHHLGLPRRTLTELGAAGLLHDVGKVLTPQAILNKPGRLTPEELSVVQRHPAHGKAILEGCEGIGRTLVDVAYTHHERLDGSGYPRGLREGDLGILSRIVAITDTYDAATTERVYADAKTSIEAFKILQAASGNQYDGQLVSELIGAVGLFPPGSTVQLNNGRYAVVLRANRKYEFRPSVLVLRDAKRRPVKPRYLDLADAAGGASASFQIARLVRGADCGIDSGIFRDQVFLQSAVS